MAGEVMCADRRDERAFSSGGVGRSRDLEALAEPAQARQARRLGLAWTYTPRKLKLAAAGAVALALISLAGAVAALVVVLNQLG